MAPQAFQYTSDGTLWILDSLNNRVVAFRGGTLAETISTERLVYRPRLFAVSGAYLYLADGAEWGTRLYRWDEGRYGWMGGLTDPNGDRLFTTRMHGLWDGKVLLTGTAHPWELSDETQPASQFFAAVLDPTGVRVAYYKPTEGAAVADPQGRIYFARALADQEADRLPMRVLAERGDGSWYTVHSFVLPRNPELAAQRPRAIRIPLGFDLEGNFYVALEEGRSLRTTFFRVDPQGQVTASATTEQLGIDDTGISELFDCEGYQVLADGSILAMYPVREEFRICKITL